MGKTPELETEVVRTGADEKSSAPEIVGSSNGESGWHSETSTPSLPEVHRTIAVNHKAKAWRRLLVFLGPGYLVAVGYMDPGNWATDIGGGAAYNYALMSVVFLASLTAMFLQALSAKLGIVTGRDLAQACRDSYPRPVAIFLWLAMEAAIVACDIAEVLGAAIALNLLFHLPIVPGVILTSADVLIVLALQHKGFRWIESLVIALIATITFIFVYETIITRPEWRGVLGGLVPTSQLFHDKEMLFLALGILGATVMPHNLFLHSSIIQTRNFGKTEPEIKDAIRMSYIDSSVALTLAFFVNAAILVVAAAVFYRAGRHDVQDIAQAYKLLTPLLGVSLAAPLFAIALLASGQNSTLTGTLAGQIILEGFTKWHVSPWVRRLISRLLAIVPSIGFVVYYGEKGITSLMLLSQTVLAALLILAIVPLIQFTSDKRKMGKFVNGPFIKWFGWTLTVIIAVLNVILIYQTMFPSKS